MSILEVNNVSKSFGGVKANVDISMSVEKGQIVGLIGPNGSGKTTLFNLLTGESKQESPELFTTLSTTTRKTLIDKDPVLISDTVGFISKLPAYMIEAFKSTLEELKYAEIGRAHV